MTKFQELRKEYKDTISPMVSKIKKLSNHADVFSVWVSGFGSIDGSEWKDEETLMGVLTENGQIKMSSPFIYVDISYGDYDNENTHKEICSLLGVSDFYDDKFYRLEYNDLDSYLIALTNADNYISSITNNNKSVLNNNKESNNMFKTKATIMPYSLFKAYEEDLNHYGITYISDFSDPSNDRCFIVMPKDELLGNFLEMADNGFIEEDALKADFENMDECEIEISLNVTFYKSEKLF